MGSWNNCMQCMSWYILSIDSLISAIFTHRNGAITHTLERVSRDIGINTWHWVWHSLYTSQDAIKVNVTIHIVCLINVLCMVHGLSYAAQNVFIIQWVIRIWFYKKNNIHHSHLICFCLCFVITRCIVIRCLSMNSTCKCRVMVSMTVPVVKWLPRMYMPTSHRH